MRLSGTKSRGFFLGSILVSSLCLFASDGPERLTSPEPQEEFSGGETTVFDSSPKAFGFPARNLQEKNRAAFFVGHSFFNENWVVAPASTIGRDGLGPLFNARSCSACHSKDGRSRPPELDKPMVTMLMRVSMPGVGLHGAPLPEPTYGGQIQGQAIPGVRAEADVFVRYQEVLGQFADGESFSLRKPIYSITNLGYAPFEKGVMVSPRVAPAMIGMGLLEAIPVKTLEDLSKQQRLGIDGIAGRLNYVWDAKSGRKAVGRFGWKAEQPSVFQQTVTAFVQDMGITSSAMPAENNTANQKICAKPVSDARPDISEKILNDVVLYSRVLAVPGRRNVADPVVLRGRERFAQANCSSCHVPRLQTGSFPELPELSNQTIRPFTDLLLHDMGDGLADHRPVFEASGRDWRTPPLWGIGLVAKVNGHTFFLHDGRARNLTEAILWHGGEALGAREKFRSMPKSDRDALIEFLKSL